MVPQKMENKKYILFEDTVTACQDEWVWAHYMACVNIREIALSVLAQCQVSTRFLGEDKNTTGHGAPILFETVVVREDGARYVANQFSTLSDARNGHHLVCSLLQEDDLVVNMEYQNLLQRLSGGVVAPHF